MKNWITPNTIILLVLVVALIHLHACNTWKSTKEKAVSETTLIKREAIGIQAAPANSSDHVCMTGSYAIDSHNSWIGFHPATEIEKI